jgi:glc operon protein GlcG
MSITLEEAERALDAAVATANEQGTKMNIAVVDAGGRLVAFKRMNGAIWAGVYGSQGKAVASAAFGRDSGVMQERAGAPIIQGIMTAEGGHMIPSQGAVPIIRNGVVIGAIGCGGGTGQEDEDCARAGAEAV